MFIIYLYLIPIIACLLIIINYLIFTSNSYIEKNLPFECGFTSYQQTRSTFNIAFILIAILFLPFDLEISSLLPYVISNELNNIYGLTIFILFFIILIMAFVYEINLNALIIYDKSNKDIINKTKTNLNIKLFKYE